MRDVILYWLVAVAEWCARKVTGNPRLVLMVNANRQTDGMVAAALIRNWDKLDQKPNSLHYGAVRRKKHDDLQ